MVMNPHEDLIVPVVRAMRANLATGLTLHEMAEVACLSPFHFHRQFQRIMGVAPGQFFTSLRVDAAKRLLLTTDESVVDICYAVGYSSPGTFTTRFAQLVGETPTGFRALPEACDAADLWTQGLQLAGPCADPRPMGAITGPDDLRGLIFVGAFDRGLPQGLPAAGVLLDRPGPYAFSVLPDGCYHLLVAAIPAQDPQSLFLPGEGLLVGIGSQRLQIIHGGPLAPVNVLLRKPIETDPPILVALPMLLRRQVVHLSATL